MALFKKGGSKNWNNIKDREFKDSPINRDVHSNQSMERGEIGESESSLKEKIGACVIALILGALGYAIAGIILVMYDYIQVVSVIGIIDAKPNVSLVTTDVRLYGVAIAVFLLSWAILYQKFMMSWKSRNSMTDTTDINTYENDQHILLFEEAQEKFDWFPDAGAHASPQVSSLLMHNMISRKGIKSVLVTKRYDKDVRDESGSVIYFAGEPMCDDNGKPITEKLPLIDEAFGQELFTASGIPRSEKEIRMAFNVRHIPYNPKDESGNRKDRDKLDYDMVVDMINGDWEFPAYEVQRPAGAYLVDTAPVNTMVLAITRAGKGKLARFVW